MHRPVSDQQHQQSVWYCPSRWLLAHHDQQANIQTLSSHMCLADLNNDGENLLALIDLKQSKFKPSTEDDDLAADTFRKQTKPPYDCRMRIYRGQQLIYNHFLDDVPSCLIATSVTLPIRQRTMTGKIQADQQLARAANQQPTNEQQQQPLLTLAINDDVYFYHKLRPSHRISLEDDDCILDSLNRSEIDAWRMVKQDKVDVDTMRELLYGLSQEFGNHELTSHSINFLSLNTTEARKQYLAGWKFKRSQNGLGENLMSMDTICCAAARLRYDSNVTRSGDFGQTRESGNYLINSRWNRILDIQRDGLVIGTEDRHLLVYELRTIRTRLECHFRLPSVPDHILVERRSPSSFHSNKELRSLTYKIIVSCRNCHIYSIDLAYLNETKSTPSNVNDLLSLKCNVLALSWCRAPDDPANSSPGSESQSGDGLGEPDFVAACLDRRVYCFNSQTGQCKWIVKLDSPITGLVSLPKLQIGAAETSLVGVASQSNRIDFYTSSSGRIVDSIYFSQDDYPQAITFGRFGREDNCLCLATRLGHLLIFILKRTAKFAHGQCLSSAASYASESLEKCGQLLHDSQLIGWPSKTGGGPPVKSAATTNPQAPLELSRPPSLPSAFALTKSMASGATNQVIESILHTEHDCNKVSTKSVLDTHLAAPQVQVPAKGRDFVDQILEQSRSSRTMARSFAKHLHHLRDKIKLTIEQQQADKLFSRTINGLNDGNHVGIASVVGLGRIYRVCLALHLSIDETLVPDSQCPSVQPMSIQLIQKMDSGKEAKRVLVKPFRFKLDQLDENPVERGGDGDNEARPVRKLIDQVIQFKLYMDERETSSVDGESVCLDVLVLSRVSLANVILKPIMISSINISLS